MSDEGGWADKSRSSQNQASQCKKRPGRLLCNLAAVWRTDCALLTSPPRCQVAWPQSGVRTSATCTTAPLPTRHAQNLVPHWWPGRQVAVRLGSPDPPDPGLAVAVSQALRPVFSRPPVRALVHLFLFGAPQARTSTTPISTDRCWIGETCCASHNAPRTCTAHASLGLA
jgi:hypothetical protein